MAARTRTVLKTIIQLNTGRPDKDTLIEYLCDSALKEAVLYSVRKKQTFRDTITQRTWAITLGNDYVRVMGTGGADGDSNNDDITDIITARIIDSSSNDNAVCLLKGRQWWDSNVVNGADNVQGWPKNCIRLGDFIFFDRPVESNKVLYLRCCTIPTFSSDATTCPIRNLDLYVEYWVTAKIFKSLEQDTQYQRWYGEAMLQLNNALEADIDTGKDNVVENSIGRNNGIAIRNLIDYDLEGGTVPGYGDIIQHF